MASTSLNDNELLNSLKAERENLALQYEKTKDNTILEQLDAIDKEIGKRSQASIPDLNSRINKALSTPIQDTTETPKFEPYKPKNDLNDMVRGMNKLTPLLPNIEAERIESTPEQKGSLGSVVGTIGLMAGRSGDKIAELLSKYLTPKEGNKRDLAKELSTELPEEFYTTNDPEVKRRLLMEQLRKRTTQAGAIDTFGRITNRWGDEKYDPSWLAQQKETAGLDLKGFEQTQKEASAEQRATENAKKFERQQLLMSGQKDKAAAMDFQDKYEKSPVIANGQALDGMMGKVDAILNSGAGSGKAWSDLIAKFTEANAVVRSDDVNQIIKDNGGIESIKTKVSELIGNGTYSPEAKKKMRQTAIKLWNATVDGVNKYNQRKVQEAKTFGIDNMFLPVNFNKVAVEPETVAKKSAAKKYRSKKDKTDTFSQAEYGTLSDGAKARLEEY